MKLNKLALPDSYTDVRGKAIKRSARHEEMWIIEHGDGTFHNIKTDDATMMKLHPQKKGIN
jgi:hypothetical protein